jgi:hypothetical protein
METEIRKPSARQVEGLYLIGLIGLLVSAASFALTWINLQMIGPPANQTYRQYLWINPAIFLVPSLPFLLLAWRIWRNGDVGIFLRFSPYLFALLWFFGLFLFRSQI